MGVRLLLSLCLTLSVSFAEERSDPQSIIDAVNNAGTTWRAGYNFPKDRDVSRMLGGRKPPVVTLPVKVSDPDALRTRVPDQFDARIRWNFCPTISHVYDQGACGSCWAVTSSSVLADRFCIATGGNFTEKLSARHLLSCCGKMCGSGCDGGDDYRAWVFFRKNGLVTGGGYGSDEGCQPYPIEPCSHYTETDRPSCTSVTPPSTPECANKCTNDKYTGSFTKTYKTKRSYKVMSNPLEMQREILKNGPVQSGITVYEDLAYYKSGVYRHVAGKLIGAHSVRILGWGFEGSTPYWLVANSWNFDWGEGGTFKIVRGKNECGIEEAVYAGEPLVE